MRKYMISMVIGILGIICWSIPAGIPAAFPLNPATDDTTVISLWPGTPPYAAADTFGTETAQPARGDNVIRLTNVSHPTLTIYPAKTTGSPTPAVLICPGGGYHILAMNLEGTELAAWFNSLGITAAILKYRVPQNRKGAFADGQRALGLLRARAKEWHIDPEHIGVMGFSAGGHLSARLSTHFHQRSYQPVDDYDATSCRPDFAMLIYPAYLVDQQHRIAPEVLVDNGTPPAFLVQAQDDPIGVRNTLYYYASLTRHGIPAEIHLFATGGHGYGMRSPASRPISHWPDLCKTWLQSLDIIKAAGSN